MDDDEIAHRIQRQGLEIEYLRELAASLGFAEEEGWSDAVFEGIEHASAEQRRAAALRTLGHAEETAAREPRKERDSDE